MSLLDEAQYDSVFAFKYSPRPNTPALQYADAIPDAEKARRLAMVLERQREIQTQRNKRHIGQTMEVMVEGRNETRAQWIGRTSQNKILNFVVQNGSQPRPGTYVQVRVLASFPNSLVGQMVV